MALNRFFFFAAWGCIVFLSWYFLAESVASWFAGYRSAAYLANRAGVIMHFGGGTLSLLLGPLQFVRVFRLRFPFLHRTMGKVYIIGTMIAGASALRLSLISDCIPCRVSLFILAVFAIVTTSLAWMAARKKQFLLHQQFMVRSYVVVFSFVAVRLDSIVPMEYLFGVIDDPVFRRTVQEYFFSFVPLLVTEVLLTWLPDFRNKLST